MPSSLAQPARRPPRKLAAGLISSQGFEVTSLFGETFEVKSGGPSHGRRTICCSNASLDREPTLPSRFCSSLPPASRVVICSAQPPPSPALPVPRRELGNQVADESGPSAFRFGEVSGALERFENRQGLLQSGAAAGRVEHGAELEPQSPDPLEHHRNTALRLDVVRIAGDEFAADGERFLIRIAGALRIARGQLQVAKPLKRRRDVAL